MATHATAARVSDRTASVQRLLARAAARGPGAIRLAILSLSACALLLAFLTWPTEVPRSIFAPLIVFAGLGLGMRRLRYITGLAIPMALRWEMLPSLQS